MSTESDRRAPHVARIPFEAMVEVGGALGPSFEAQAVNLSEQGMQLRTAYLPEVGQPVTCRFDAGNGQIVVAAGEVLWNEEVGDGGEFGIRFTNLDTPSAAALGRILGLGDGAGAQPVRAIGRKVRLHIEGLASPMRARVKDANDECLTAFSDLGFLQVGKPLELEDTTTGAKRPAIIDGVAVELEQASRIPQLVVSLRYDEAPARVGLDSEAPVTIEAPVDAGPSPAAMAMRASIDLGEAHDVDVDGDEDPCEDEAAGEPPHQEEAVRRAAASAERGASRDGLADEPEDLKSPFARTAAKVTPALEKWAKRARTTVALLAARRRGEGGDDVAVPMRRTTAPAPGGGLHASGRKVVRGDLPDDAKADEVAKTGLLAGKVTKKRAAAAGAVGVAVLLGLLATRTPAPPPSAPADETAAATTPVAPEPPPAPAPVTTLAAAPTLDPMAASAMAEDTPPEPPRPQKKVKVAPFGNGPVGRNGNVLRLKMDGAVEKIHGASQPTGFTVVIPDRKSLDAASPLAAKDPRIAAIRVANEPNGAELSVTFKDGVPNYLVRAKGDHLELVLARPAQNGDKPAAAHASPKKKPRGKRR